MFGAAIGKATHRQAFLDYLKPETGPSSSYFSAIGPRRLGSSWPSSHHAHARAIAVRLSWHGTLPRRRGSSPLPWVIRKSFRPARLTARILSIVSMFGGRSPPPCARHRAWRPCSTPPAPMCRRWSGNMALYVVARVPAWSSDSVCARFKKQVNHEKQAK